jgi:hypothetical protein
MLSAPQYRTYQALRNPSRKNTKSSCKFKMQKKIFGLDQGVIGWKSYIRLWTYQQYKVALIKG